MMQLIIIVIIFLFNIQSDSSQNVYKYSMLYSKLLQESNLTTQGTASRYTSHLKNAAD